MKNAFLRSRKERNPSLFLLHRTPVSIFPVKINEQEKNIWKREKS